MHRQICAKMPLTKFIMNHSLSDYSKEEVGIFFIALQIAICRHADQFRDSGENFHEHVLAVSQMIRELDFGIEVQIAGLLHDVMEDCGMKRTEIANRFGHRVATMVWSVSKPTKSEDFFKKILKATKCCPEVIFIKLVDRLHNLTTVYGLRTEEKQRRFLKETLGPMAQLITDCRPHIPAERKVCYDELSKAVLLLAREKLEALDES